MNILTSRRHTDTYNTDTHNLAIITCLYLWPTTWHRLLSAVVVVFVLFWKMRWPQRSLMDTVITELSIITVNLSLNKQIMGWENLSKTILLNNKNLGMSLITSIINRRWTFCLIITIYSDIEEYNQFIW